ncbi:MAG: SdrD B-like domain-containing protein, partial [Pyrinomonadaceae bacterium]
FLSPQNGARDPLDLKAAGVNWSPRKWLSTSFNASIAKRPGDPTKQDRSATAAVAITPGGTSPRFYFSHTQNSSIQARSSAFSLFNASKDFSRWRVFLNATRVKTLGTATSNAQFGANFLINDTNSLEVSQGIGSKRSLTGQIDWRSSGLLGKRLSFTAGAGYSYGQNSKFSAYERVTASLTLPRQTSLQVSYMNTNAGPTLLVSIKGSLLRKRESSAFLNAPLSEVNSFAKVSGRVYQDVNMNGRFDAEVDKPQVDVKVQVDGNRYVVSDAAGQYSFGSVLAGDHKVSLDLLSVRADLTLLSGGEQAAALKAGSSSTVDFRLVRTGRLRGRVWLDANENGKFDDGEKPLADVRVVTASGRDTLTDADGYYIIGDLAPGEHVILIDEKTLPEKTRSAAGSLSMQVFPGRETSDVTLAVIFIPAEVKRFGTKTNSPQ